MSESSNFNKLVKLLAGGGALVLKRAISKWMAPLTFSEYIYQSQGAVLKLKLTEKQRQLIINRDVHKMDITLLCKLALELFKDKVTDIEKSCVVAIRTERDGFMHSELLESAKLDSQAFESRWSEISAILLDFAEEIGDPSFISELKVFIDEAKKVDPDIKEILETLKEWCLSNTELKDKIDALARSVEELKGITRLFAYCKGGNFNIHIWALFGYFIS